MLRQAMATSRPPTLSARFDERLSQRLPRPRRRLTAKRRAGLAAYSVAAVAISVGLMRWADIEWRLLAAALGTPIAFATVACRRCVVLAWRMVSTAAKVSA
jgi:hypothetical protein